jgi:MFS transporter, FHS family, glucose/mannose:H+ symporter
MYKRNLVFAAACLGMFVFGVVFLSLGSVVNMLKAKFALDQSGVGTLTAVLPLGILVGSLIFGPLVDRYGYKLLLAVSVLLVALGLEGLAVAKTPGVVKICFFLIGFGGGSLNGGTNALVADISEGERGAKLSLLGVSFGLGALGITGILAALSGIARDETVIAVIGAAIVAPVLYFLALRFPAAKQSKGFSLREGLAMLAEPALLLFALVAFFQSGLEGTTNDWSPVFMKEKVLFSDREARIILTSYVAAMTLTRILLSKVLALASSRRVLFGSLAVAFAGCLLVLLSPARGWAVVGLLLLGVGYAACFPVVLGLVADVYPQRSGTAFGVLFSVALIGNMTINKSTGWITQTCHDIGALPQVLLVALAALTISLSLALLRLRRLAALKAPAPAAASAPALTP